MAIDITLYLGCLWVAIAAVFDLRSGHIPNALTLGGAVLGVGLALGTDLLGADAPGLSQALLSAGRLGFACVLCGLVPYLLFSRDAMGGGDVKLLAGLGVLLGPVRGLEVQLYAFVAMAAYALVQLALRGELRPVLQASLRILARPLRRSATYETEVAASVAYRFGPAIFVGMLWVTWSAA